jgi:uncharacterized protein YcaQ
MTPDQYKSVLSDTTPRLKGTNNTMTMEQLYQKGNHKCSHEKDWERIDQIEDRVCDLERDRKTEREELEKRDKTLKEAFDNNTTELKEIKDIVIRLDKQQAETKVQNGYQDKQIEGIQVNEREKIRNKWVIIGLVVGSFIGPIVVKIIELYTPL